MVCTSASALGDPPITPPSDPSAIPTTPSEFTTPQPALHQLKLAVLNGDKRQIRLYRKSDCHWQTLMGKRCASTSSLVYHTRSAAYADWVLKGTKSRSRRHHAEARHWMVKQTKVHLTHINQLQVELGLSQPMRQLAESRGVEDLFNHSHHLDQDMTKKWQSSGLYAAFMCIHSGEGSMTSVSNTNPPYYGGWQEDVTFQKKYGLQFYKRWGTADHWPAWAQLFVAVKAYRSGRGFYPWPNTAHNCGLI